jgi:glycerol-3-phosphate acyltransferase PlsY
MQGLINAAVVLLAYVFGSIPFGLLIVKLKTGKDIRNVESGRTGGTNALRAAGCSAGFLTALFDVLKGAAAVWVAERVAPGNDLIHVLAPVAAILGHNHSMFLPEFNQGGRVVRLRGGAGGAPAVGGALGLLPQSFLIIAPLAAVVFFAFGIASLTTLSAAFFALVIFTMRAAQGSMPWTDVLYPLSAQVLLVWALRPNLKRLFKGEERVVKYSLAGILRRRREKPPRG